MLKYLLLIICTTQLLHAQQAVKPVISTEYLLLINSDSMAAGKADSSAWDKDFWRLNRAYTYSLPVKNLKMHNGVLTIIPAKKTYLTLGGNFTTTVAIKAANAIPLLQNEYVQGESINGALSWQGPETGEMFSYGPSVHSLEYDGSKYPYDINGRLVKAGTGDGKKANIYNNSVLRNGYMLNHSFSLLGNVKHDYLPDWSFSLKASTINGPAVIQDNSNTDNNFSAFVERNIQKYTITGTYNYFISRFSNDNRSGFLNRVYENSLLAPISFADAQGYAFANGSQRSYSQLADNPLFLLNNNGHSFQRAQQTGSVSVQKKLGYFTFAVIPSVDAVHQNSYESLKAGTAFFASGLPLYRMNEDRHYTLGANASYAVRYNNYHYVSSARVNYVYNNEQVNIAYQPAGTSYKYRRTSNDVSVAYNSTYEYRDISAGLNGGDKVYQSNTAGEAKYFQPDVSGFIRFSQLFDYPFDIKLASTYNSFYSEPAINNSYASYTLTQFAPQDALKFMPVTEAQGFTGIQPIQHNEFTSKIEVQYSYRVTLSAGMFIRKTNNDVFPVYQSGVLSLKNLADSRFSGFELQLDVMNIPKWTKDFSLTNTISFYTYNSTVTRVADGYNNTPVAGFSTVYKAVIEGKPLGAIVGSSYLKDANNRIIIDNNGYPMVNSQPTVIGNPAPDFTIKFSHNITWKRFSCNIDWEYKKGGDVWNGTQAVLDYYGRSATTAAERNITGYVFNGVSQNGRQNTVPVNFYDASLPVEQNRWARYGYTGVAESYIQKSSALRLHNFSLAYTINCKKYIQKIRVLAYAENLLIWSAYKGADANQLLFGQPGSAGLDFFNLPSTKNLGINVSIQF